MGYENKSVLITGAGSGFGQRLTERLSGMGARLVLGDINEAGLEATKALCTGPVTPLRCDVSKEADCQALVAAGVEAYGGLDVSYNNAGMGGHGPKPLHEVTHEEFDLTLRVNTYGVFYGMKAQIPVMLQAGSGVILNTSSVAGILGAPFLGAYAAAKHAVVGLTRAAPSRCAPAPVRAPGMRRRRGPGPTAPRRPRQARAAAEVIGHSNGSRAARPTRLRYRMTMPYDCSSVVST